MKNERIDWREAELPLKTETYTPVPHEELIDVVSGMVREQGYDIARTGIQQNLKGSQIVATSVIIGNDGNPEYAQSLVYTNSYDKRIPIRFVTGGNVFVCLNGMIVGDILSYRKHTSNVLVDLKGIIQTAINGFETDYFNMNADIDMMKGLDLTRQMTGEIIGRLLYEESILIPSEVNEVIRQLKKPKFESFSDNSIWSLYNHCTYAMKEAAPGRQMIALKALHDFMKEYSYELANLGR